MQRPPRNRKESIFAGGLGFDIAFQGLIIAAVTVFSYFVGVRMESGAWGITESPAGMTMAFLTLSMIEIFHSFNMRSRVRSLFSIKKQNMWLWGTLAFSLLITAAVIFVPFLNSAFSFLKNYDTNKDGKLSATEINDVIDMSCRYASISSLEGIEYFSKLEILDCEGNSLTKLDVSKCTALGSLYCLNNKLTSLNVSGCKELATLECEKNKLTSLDISNNTALISLDCFNNKLTSLNLNKNANLEHLNCANNQISSLNVTNCTYIKEYVQKNSRLTVNNVDTWGDGNGNFEVLTVDRTVKVTAGSVVSKPTLKTVKSKNGKYELSGSTATLVGVTNNKLTTLTVADSSRPGETRRRSCPGLFPWRRSTRPIRI